MYRLLHIARTLLGQGFIDRLRYRYHGYKNRRRNAHFKKAHPETPLPPPYMLYESFKLDYQAYFESGLKTAQWIIGQCSTHQQLDHARILDWGCGPARVTRHMAQLLPLAQVHGTDYNSSTIKWCSESFDKIDFRINKLNPPTEYPADNFDLIYGISIFTHLSENNHFNWTAELHRILADGGIALITTHGDAHKVKLTPAEQIIYEDHQMVFRQGEKEGHRTCTAFHPPAAFMKLVQEKFMVLHHEPGKIHDWGIGQDTWILKALG